MGSATRDSHDKIYLQWEKFIKSGGQDRSLDIRVKILESWKRCFRQKVDPYDEKIHRSLKGNKLNKLLRDNQWLIDIAKPFMANLHKFVKGSGFVVVLTDDKGYIMELFTDEGTKQNPLTKNFFIGASWREEEAGTNAIGTALVLGEPIQVSGAEHYCQKHHCLTCSAAPIFDTNGKIIGILDMSGASHAAHLHTLGMVVAAAEAIMAQIKIRRKNSELALINTRLTNFFNTVSDGVLLVDKDEVVVEYNPAAKVLLGREKQNIIGIPFKKLFDYRSSVQREKIDINHRYSDVEIMVETKDGLCCCLVSGEPIVNERGEVTGGLMILRPIKQVQNLVNRFSGYMATLDFNDIVGESPEIQEVIRLAKLTASSSSNVLLQGESGTGKEIFAQAIHNGSEQRNGPFIPVNCGAIPRELIGSELFGYEEGAFTGAKRGGKPGKFELANGGTLFLDEIGDMPLDQQTALLRVIQEKKVARIGSDKMIPVNVRLICATNKNLRQEVEKGTFREDLFYRLNVISIIIPPLRNRVSDIPLLFEHFLQKLTRDWGYKFYVEPEVLECLKRYSWPGNVRELQNIVERAALLAENGIITVRNLPPEIIESSGHHSLSLTLANYSHQNIKCRQERRKTANEIEKYKIINLLNSFGGNVSKVAKEMGVSRKTVYNKMRIYSIKN